ncbi:MAG TPA: hypothetical protein VFL91_21380 [Thermomicrobiales bacterium]|nr:hypothetical protein [Thermomicrobiales bacterium]
MSEETTERGRLDGFDPRKHLRVLRGRGGNSEYLDIKWRLVWLRKEHPDAVLETEHVAITDNSAIFRARVSIPGGAVATGYGSETAADFGDWLEKAESKAIGRALAALGYGTQFVDDFDMEDEHGVEVADAPVESRRPARQDDVRPIRQDSRPERYPQARAGGGGAPQASATAPATERQLKFITAISREARLGDDELLDWIEELHGTRNLDALTRLQASDLIERLQRRRVEQS